MKTSVFAINLPGPCFFVQGGCAGRRSTLEDRPYLRVQEFGEVQVQAGYRPLIAMALCDFTDPWLSNDDVVMTGEMESYRE
jgi:hypothetical protein